MKKLVLITLLLSMAVGFNACKKDDKTSTPTNNEPKEDIIEIKTSFGTMYMWLYKETPLHRANFLKLANEGFYTNTTFHRIISNFVIQGGDPNSKDNDPNNDGNGGPGYTIPAEIKGNLTHSYGAVGAARLPDSVNPNKESSGSQFYIVVNTGGTANLNGGYTVFGKIINGLNNALTIAAQPNSGNPNNRPTTDIKMEVKVVSKTLAELKSEFNFVP